MLLLAKTQPPILYVRTIYDHPRYVDRLFNSYPNTELGQTIDYMETFHIVFFLLVIYQALQLARSNFLTYHIS